MSDFTREELISSLRVAADVLEAAVDIPAPTVTTSVYINVYGPNGKDAFRRLYRMLGVDPTVGDYFVSLPVGPGVTFDFSKSAVCTRRMEPREVEVYELDPELLLPTVDEQQAADDARMDAQADADAEARDLGFHDAECRAEIEQDAMRDELAGAEQ